MLLTPLIAVAASMQFTSTLRQGLRSDEVYNLQVFLKISPPTGYFGPLTLAAVTKFQQLYAIPPTGLVGPLTRAKLNSLLVSQPASSQPKTAPIITSVSPLNLPAGNTITVSGLSLNATGNVLRLGDRVISEISKSTAGSIIFRAPTDIPAGQYNITITTPAGLVSNPIQVLILNASTVDMPTEPSIASLTPDRGGYGTQVAITGTRFSTTTNDIYIGYLFGYVKISAASSDGKTLSFTIPADADLPQLHFRPEQLSQAPGASFPFSIFVKNTLGESEAALFTFTFYN